MKYYIKTYGCQMNERESESLACLLDARGHQEALTEDDADVIVLNTCSVRDQAEQKAIGKAGILVRLKQANPKLILGIIGCMAQNRGETLFEKIPHLDFVAGTEQLHQVPDIIERIHSGESRIAELESGTRLYYECPGHKGANICAMVSIMRGCNQFCSYCIVPHTRGRERSRDPQAVVDEVKCLADNGTREILLLGQNITAYGLVEARENGTYTPEISPFAELLEKLNEVPGIERIRFTSPHVRFMNDRYVEAVCTLPKVCKSFHIPLQSGSDRILKMMRRNYTAEQYLERIAAIKARLPEVSFSTDVIVGFPGETEEDFLATRNTMQQVGFDMAYIFRYSPRQGTWSEQHLADDIPEKVKHERNQILLGDLEQHAAATNAKLVGHVFPVLVEGVSRRNQERWTGRTELNKTCNFHPVEGVHPGDLVDIRITAASANALTGEIVSSQR